MTTLPTRYLQETSLGKFVKFNCSQSSVECVYTTRVVRSKSFFARDNSITEIVTVNGERIPLAKNSLPALSEIGHIVTVFSLSQTTKSLREVPLAVSQVKTFNNTSQSVCYVHCANALVESFGYPFTSRFVTVLLHRHTLAL